MNIVYLKEKRDECLSKLERGTSRIYLQEFLNIYNATKKQNKKQRELLKEFQYSVRDIRDWTVDKIKEQHFLFTRQCDVFDNLVRSIFKLHLAIYNCMNDSSFDAAIPNPGQYLHETYLSIARRLWKEPYLLYDIKVDKMIYQKNMLRLEKIIRKCLRETFLFMLPFKEFDEKLAQEEEEEEDEDYEIVPDSPEDMEEASDEEEEQGEQQQDEETHAVIDDEQEQEISDDDGEQNEDVCDYDDEQDESEDAIDKSEQDKQEEASDEQEQESEQEEEQQQVITQIITREEVAEAPEQQEPQHQEPEHQEPQHQEPEHQAPEQQELEQQEPEQQEPEQQDEEMEQPFVQTDPNVRIIQLPVRRTLAERKRLVKEKVKQKGFPEFAQARPSDSFF